MNSHDVVDVAAMILLFVVVIFCLFLHLYVKWFWRLPEQEDHNTRRRPQHSGITVLRRGLHPSFLKTIPVIAFDPKEFEQGLECAVCLSEVGEGEKARILPKCCHGFHVECIDMWFHSHSTCPICRNPVSDQTEISVENLLQENGDFPTNILFWGDETEVSTLTSQLEEHHHQPSSWQQTDLVIDIPNGDEDPLSSRMRSLKQPLDNNHYGY